jgi:[protein-PII] uridylyltransferase
MSRMIPGIQHEPSPAVARAARAVREMRATIAAQHAAAGPGVQTCWLASDLIDRIVVDLWQSILTGLPPEQAAAVERQAAVVAHGGYGRREMAPFSDVDLMILHEPSLSMAVEGPARQIMQDLFDAGLQVGQSVRSVSEACRLAAADATIFSTLTASRVLAGHAPLLDRLMEGLRGIARRNPARLVDQLVAARREEADRFGETVSLLEPNVKRSPGGLRDIQLARWLGFAAHGSTSFDDLALTGGMSRRDADSLRDAAEFLMRLRNDLHLAAGRSVDDLTRSEQVRIAGARGIESRGGLLSVERFMGEYFHHTKQVAHVVENAIASSRGPRPIREWLAGLTGRRVEGLFRVGPGSVAAVPGRAAEVAASPAFVVRLVDLASRSGLPINHATWEAVREATQADSLDGQAAGPAREADAETRVRFLELFARGDRIGGALRRLHEVGLLERIIPQFAHARNLLQFNNYHKYTVDEHCILAVERALELAADDSWLGNVWRGIRRKRTVLLALLIHDLGKGFEEDHSEVGARIARDVATRFGLPEDEAAIIETLVLKHLSMAQIAFRRNIGDDSIVVRFACDVGSPEVLAMLTALTAADVAAVGPGTWTRWKADLLGDLYFRTLSFLDGEGPSVAAERHDASLRQMLAGLDRNDPVAALAGHLPRSYLGGTEPGRILGELRQLCRLSVGEILVSARWQPETSTVAVSVGAHENVATGVFHRLAGSLASLRLEILSADIHTLPGGLLLDQFVVQDPDFAGEPPKERLAEIADAIRAGLVAVQPPSFTRRWNPFAPILPPAAMLPVRVLFDNESSEQTTILEVFAHDSVGLLYAITKVLHDAGISVQSAKIGTYLDQVVDAFHITDLDGRKIVDPERIDSLRRAIEKVAEPVRSPSSGG